MLNPLLTFTEHADKSYLSHIEIHFATLFFYIFQEEVLYFSSFYSIITLIFYKDLYRFKKSTFITT